MTGQIRLASPPWHRRLLGAVAAVAASGLLIIGLDSAAPPPTGPKLTRSAAPITVLLRPVARLPAERRGAAPPRKTAAAVARQPKPARAPQTAHPAAMTLVPTPSLPAPARDAVIEAAAATRPASAASMPTPRPAAIPLRLDAEVLRSASTASRGSVKLMADAAGRQLDSTTSDERSRWTRAIDSSARPDCLAPNEQASLLAAFSIAARAVAGRCP